VTTTVTGNVGIDTLFTDMNVQAGTWYRIWVGDETGTGGEYIDTKKYNKYGNGWIAAEDLSRVTLTAPESGKSIEFWIRAWNRSTGILPWEHWSIANH